MWCHNDESLLCNESCLLWWFSIFLFFSFFVFFSRCNDGPNSFSNLELKRERGSAWVFAQNHSTNHVKVFLLEKPITKTARDELHLPVSPLNRDPNERSMKIRFYYRPGSNQIKFFKKIFFPILLFFFYFQKIKMRKKYTFRGRDKATYPKIILFIMHRVNSLGIAISKKFPEILF